MTARNAAQVRAGDAVSCPPALRDAGSLQAPGRAEAGRQQGEGSGFNLTF